MLILSIKADSQQFYFPQKAYTYTTEMNRAIPSLAIQLIEFLNKSLHPDSNEYHEELFKYQIAAGKFGEAMNSYNVLSQKIAVTDPNLAQTIYFIHRAYTTVKFRQGRTGRPLNTVVTNLLMMQFKTFPKDQWRDIEVQFLIDMEPMQKKFTDKKSELKNLYSDSLNYEDARSLCLSYTDYRVYVTLLTVALPVLGEIKSENQNISFQDSVLLSTRDGAVLSARIAIKKNISRPLPVILMFSIYPGLATNNLKLQTWADNDYVGTMAFTRGKYLSPHEVEPFEHDAEDAYDLIEWISKQPWCNDDGVGYR